MQAHAHQDGDAVRPPLVPESALASAARGDGRSGAPEGEEHAVSIGPDLDPTLIDNRSSQEFAMPLQYLAVAMT
jgi:hypothetical protein